MNKRISLILILFLMVAISVSAQTTIGSSEKHNSGSLLDLKENSKVGANSTKGLLLPRVKLSTLEPPVGKFSESIGGIGVWDEGAHKGLLVYNVKKIDACEGGTNVGVYSWNGAKWLALYEKKIVPPTIETSTDEIEGANSYILLKGGSTVAIPIKRAYDIWNKYAGTSIDQGKVLDKTDVDNLNLPSGSSLVANVLWQETNTGTSTGVLDATTPVTIEMKTPESASILTVKSGTKSGNALVNVTLGAGGKVLWQWHIWVVDTDPRETAYAYNTGKKNYWFMDRSLGANDNNENGANALYYQWGRPTPMRRLGNIPTIAAAATEKENLSAAIQTDKFITFSSTVSHDWYSSKAKQWDSRWGDQSRDKTVNKSSFDPCPYGWRVASAVEGASPWHCLNESEGSHVGTWNFDEIGRDIGLYILSGYRSNGNGSLGELGMAGYVWTASPSGALAGFLHYTGSKINPWASYNRANGFYVRCVKDIK